jgi:hypothetical protein
LSTDLAIHMHDQPGALARITNVLGDADVNIGGFCAVTSGGGRAEAHILVDDATAAFSALGAAGIVVASEQEVLVVSVDDRPGVLGDVSRRLGESGVNITLAYLATSTRLVFAADNLAAAKAALA